MSAPVDEPPRREQPNAEPVQHDDDQRRLASASVVLALLALVLLRVVVLSLPLALGAVWYGIRANRAGPASATATTGIVLGAIAGVLGVGLVGGTFALGEIAERRMPSLVSQHDDALRPALVDAAADVFPCEGRVEGVELLALRTGFPEHDGRAALSLGEVGLAEVEVRVAGASYPVRMTGAPGEGWSVNDRDALARACEALGDR